MSDDSIDPSDVDDASDDTAAAPRLTLGQRLLTALPNLQRNAPAPSGGDTGGEDTEPAAGGAGRRATTGGGEAERADGGRGTGGRGPGSGERGRRVDPAIEAMSRDEIVTMIKKVDDRERAMAYLAAVLGVAVGVALTIITIHTNGPARIHGHINKSHVAESDILLEGGARVLLSAIVVGAAWSRRRSFIGFALLFLGTSMGDVLLALPFWGLGGYLIWRVFKYQRALTARDGGARGGAGGARKGTAAGARGGRAAASPRAAAKAGAATARERAAARQRGRRQPPPTGPERSKRYTPPKPTRPRPPAPSP